MVVTNGSKDNPVVPLAQNRIRNRRNRIQKTAYPYPYPTRLNRLIRLLIAKILSGGEPYTRFLKLT